MALPWIKVSTLPSTGQSPGYKDDCYLVLAFKGIRDLQEKAACTHTLRCSGCTFVIGTPVVGPEKRD